jgi:N-acetylglucosamine-6-sulfatase
MMRLLRLLAPLLACTALHAAVIPVPTSVVPERIPGAKPKNVILILTDDHRFDAMSFLGHPIAETPHLDALARNGVHFKNALVTTSLCSPSRASILTGLYTFRHRVIDNNRAIPPGTLYFPQYLQRAGHATAFFGKWHMGGEDDQPQPGFDRWVSFRGQGEYLPPNPNYTLNVDGRREKQKGYITDELTDYAIDWMRQQKPAEKPFFIYLSHKAVHANFTPAARHEGKFAGKKFVRPATAADTPENYAGKPRWLRDQRNSWHGVDFPYHSDLNVDQYYQRYCETLCAVDDSVGRIVAELKKMGVYDDTLILYMGDNGFMFGEHGLIDKRVAYDASIRIPMLMQCPSLFSGGRTVEQAVANIDVGPTIMTAMGLTPPPHMDGLNFLPLARGTSTSWRDNFLYVYYWEKNFPQSPTVFALRNDRYKFITYYGLWDLDELYDLRADPGETKNLFHDPAHRATAKAMETQLYARMEELGGMDIPLNAPKGGINDKRLRNRGGQKGADFPAPLIVEKPLNQNAK